MKKIIFLVAAVAIVAAAAILTISMRKEPKKVLSSRAKFVYMEDASQDIATMQGKSEDEVCMQFGEDSEDGY